MNLIDTPAAVTPSTSQPSKPRSARKVGSKSSPSKSKPKRAAFKQDRVLAMLQRKEGASTASIMKATGWQQHSVRGFFAGVVRKKLKLNLVSDGRDGKRIYRIAAGRSHTPGSRKGSR